MSEIRSQATPARDELAAYLDRVIDNEAWANTGDEAAKHIEEQLGWSKPHTVKFGDLGSLPIGVVVRNNEGGTVAVRESEKYWFIPGLDYEIELWELENPEGDDFTVLFTPGGAE